MPYDVRERLRLGARDGYFALQSRRQVLSRSHARAVVLCNSYPKSGTHLLSQILLQFDGISNWDDIISVQSLSGVMNTPQHVRWKYESAPGGSLIRSHLTHGSRMLEILNGRQHRRFFIYRDLRDVAVSHANWVLKEPRIFLHKHYKSLDSFDQCLMHSIRGLPVGTPFGSNLSQPDIGSDFARWEPWLEEPHTLAVRFEDLVGARGGGDEALRLASVRKIADHLQKDLSGIDIATRFGSHQMDPAKSHTFRKGNKGQIGSWAGRFTPEHKEAFKAVAGQTLVQLGYEPNLSW